MPVKLEMENQVLHDLVGLEVAVLERELSGVVGCLRIVRVERLDDVGVLLLGG
jgi:hypothetical protein